MTTNKPTAGKTFEMIETPHDLRSKCKPLRGKAAEVDPIARAEQELARLSVRFDNWMEDETDAMEAAFAAHAADTSDSVKADGFYRTMHDLRGQSETFGYPLAGEVADNLCRLLETVPDRKLIPTAIVERHVQAIRAIVREQVKDGSNRIGRELADRLREIGDDLLAKLAPDAS